MTLRVVTADVIIAVMKFHVMTLGKVYQLNTQTIGRFLRRVESLVCYRCGVELIAGEWVFAKPSRGDTSLDTMRRKNWKHKEKLVNRNQPKVYHERCAKEVKLIV